MNRKKYLLKPFNDNVMNDRGKLGIETNRKGYLRFRIVDSEGNSVPGVTVRFHQKTHDFRYGANIFMLDEFECEEKNTAYREIFKEYFNLATIPFYWNTLEPEEGKPPLHQRQL